MSLPACTIETLKAENDRLKAEVEKSMFVDYWGERFRDLQAAYDKLLEQHDALELANATLKRRIISLEGDR